MFCGAATAYCTGCCDWLNWVLVDEGVYCTRMGAPVAEVVVDATEEGSCDQPAGYRPADKMWIVVATVIHKYMPTYTQTKGYT